MDGDLESTTRELWKTFFSIEKPLLSASNRGGDAS